MPLTFELQEIPNIFMFPMRFFDVIKVDSWAQSFFFFPKNGYFLLLFNVIPVRRDFRWFDEIGFLFSFSLLRPYHVNDEYVEKRNGNQIVTLT